MLDGTSSGYILDGSIRTLDSGLKLGYSLSSHLCRLEKEHA